MSQGSFDMVRKNLPKKTLSISISEEMHDFIRMRVRDGWYYSVSSYIRSLVLKDEASQVLPPKRSVYPDPRPINDIWNYVDEE